MSGVHVSADSPGWDWGALGWVSNRGVGSLPWRLPRYGQFGGVTGPGGGVWAGVAGRMWRGLRGDGGRRPPNRPRAGGGVGQKIVCSGLRRHVACIAGIRICLIRSWQRNVSRPMSFVMRTNFTGHYAGARKGVASSDCLWAGTNRMCPAGIRMRVDML